jgi:hypothetical protein
LRKKLIDLWHLCHLSPNVRKDRRQRWIGIQRNDDSVITFGKGHNQ